MHEYVSACSIYVWARTCYGTWLEVRWQISGVCLFFPQCGSWKLNSSLLLFTRCLHSLSCFHFKREKITLLFLNSRLHGFIKLSIKLYPLTLQILFPIRLVYLLDLFFNIQVKVSGITLHISQLLSLSQIPVIT